MKEFKPLVSIIIPVYNGANYVSEAIESAINQTYKNIEIIVVNDGSNDNGKTEKVVLKYKKHIKYISKENGGVSTALNVGIQNMKGEYFSWLSHDDKYEIDKIEKQIEYIKNNNLIGKDIILYSDYKLMDKNGKIISNCYKNSYLLNMKPLYSILRGAINGLTLLIPRKAFNDCGYFDEDKRCTQDYELWWKMLKKYKFIHQSIYTAITRYHSNQVSNTSPRVLSEGNPMWISFMEDLSDKEKIDLDGSVYYFYLNMSKFLKDTPYCDAMEYCISKCKELEDNFKYNKELVSVIIPTYNREEETIRAIKSVLGQDYDNYEIIVVDDCSSLSLDKLYDFVKDKSNIKIISLKKNKGAANARNVGINEASGKYIAFLDSDDEYKPNKLSTQIRLMELCGAKFSHSSYLRKDKVLKPEVIHSGIDSGWVLDKLIYACGIATPTVVLDREFIINNKLYFNSDLVIGEDTCYWIEIAKKTWLLGMDEELTIVNTNEGSAAYNNDKLIIGYKTIIKYVLNDKLLSNFNREVSYLMQDYARLVLGDYEGDFYRKRYEEIMNSKSMKITKPLRVFTEFIHRIKR